MPNWMSPQNFLIQLAHQFSKANIDSLGFNTFTKRKRRGKNTRFAHHLRITELTGILISRPVLKAKLRKGIWRASCVQPSTFLDFTTIWTLHHSLWIECRTNAICIKYHHSPYRTLENAWIIIKTLIIMWNFLFLYGSGTCKLCHAHYSISSTVWWIWHG